ncbi:MAG: folate-binding protein YgfZ [Pirellulales bacterium]
MNDSCQGNTSDDVDDQIDDQIDALVDGAGLVDCSARTQIEVSGGDRASFLHNLSTNEIRKLAVGSGCEAFFCDARGHIQAHAYIFCREQSLVIDSVPGAAEVLLPHLDRYLIREDVQLADRTAEWCQLLVAGERSAPLLSRVTGLDLATLATPVAIAETRLADVDIQLRRHDFAGPESFSIVGRREDQPRLWSALLTAGATPCGAAALDAVRIAAGSPLYGVDITSRNLPQEVARDARTINFVKGCYLGQETVARIDALGHVNRLLCGLRFADADPPHSELPVAGTPLTADGQPAGEVTSTARSRRLGPIGLGYVRREHAAPGSRLESTLGPVEVVPLPIVTG